MSKFNKNKVLTVTDNTTAIINNQLKRKIYFLFFVRMIAAGQIHTNSTTDSLHKTKLVC